MRHPLSLILTLLITNCILEILTFMKRGNNENKRTKIK